MAINSLAAQMVMDRTTLGRNVLPLQRDGLIAVQQGRRDRRSKELRLTEAGEARLRAAVKGWSEAQRHFEVAFGTKRKQASRFVPVERLYPCTNCGMAPMDPIPDTDGRRTAYFVKLAIAPRLFHTKGAACGNHASPAPSSTRPDLGSVG
jgi:hypothetical protein